LPCCSPYSTTPRPEEAKTLSIRQGLMREAASEYL